MQRLHARHLLQRPGQVPGSLRPEFGFILWDGGSSTYGMRMWLFDSRTLSSSLTNIRTLSSVHYCSPAKTHTSTPAMSPPQHERPPPRPRGGFGEGPAHGGGRGAVRLPQLPPASPRQINPLRPPYPRRRSQNGRAGSGLGPGRSESSRPGRNPGPGTARLSGGPARTGSGPGMDRDPSW
jgi:hypothetical protein